MVYEAGIIVYWLNFTPKMEWSSKQVIFGTEIKTPDQGPLVTSTSRIWPHNQIKLLQCIKLSLKLLLKDNFIFISH